ERELRDVYLRPFEAAVRDAAVGSVMNAYHELDGVPCGANRWLLTDVLRGEWGFAGSLVADYFTVRQLAEYHHIVATVEAAAALALRAGIDVELPGTDCYGDPLRTAIDHGDVEMSVVDAAVARVLTTKFQLGLFERPFVDVERVQVHTRTAEQGELARAVAADSLVLLKNDGTLPLPAACRIAVIGPNAASGRNLLGDYAYIAHVESLLEVLRSGRNVFAMPVDEGIHVDGVGDVDHITTILDALVAELPRATFLHAEGCAVNDDDRSGFEAAVDAAIRSDVAVLVLGERSGLTDDCTTGESRDVASLDLPGVQEELVLAVAATGTPVVLVLVAGRPIGSEAVHQAASAVLVAWLPGECGGRAVAEALAGARSPGGKLPITYPRSSGQIPTFYGHKASGGRSHWKVEYVDLSNEPMYPFGHGLTYSEFSVDIDSFGSRSVTVDDVFDVVDVVAVVTNVGAAPADEVVQLYSRDPIASITRPVLELQGFARVSLAPGGSARVTFHLHVASLGFTGPDMTYVVEPGEIELLVGTSSADVQPAGRVAVTGQEPVATRRISTTPVTIEYH
ncbi:MAG: glycoside hydrolase family 3 C-terminal domain-containing protein, partial [Ilumatobacteraceae bacterium]